MLGEVFGRGGFGTVLEIKGMEMNHCSAVAEGNETMLTFSNSHDGCEGLTSPGNDDLTDISQRALQTSKSYDCLDSYDALTPTCCRGGEIS